MELIKHDDAYVITVNDLLIYLSMRKDYASRKIGDCIDAGQIVTAAEYQIRMNVYEEIGGDIHVLIERKRDELHEQEEK